MGTIFSTIYKWTNKREYHKQNNRKCCWLLFSFIVCWGCVNLPFPTDGTVSLLLPWAPIAFLFLSPETCQHSGGALMGVQRYTSFRNSLPFHVCALSLPFVCAVCDRVCVSFMFLQNKSHLFRSEGTTSCRHLFIVTLYSWTTPFCSSSGGGCQETMMAVPLSPLSVTVTLRGGALGAGGNTQRRKGKKNICSYMILFFFPHNYIQSISASHMQFSCQE